MKRRIKKLEKGVNIQLQEKVYNDTIPKRCYQLCLLGLKGEELATAFGVNPATIRVWAKRHPEMRKALRLGREGADAKVAERLYMKAVGYKKKEKIVFVDKGKVVEHEYEKEYVPDTTAIIFWLKNRHPEKWADVWKMEFQGNIDFTKQENTLADLTDEELKALQKYNIIQQMQSLNETNSSGR